MLHLRTSFIASSLALFALLASPSVLGCGGDDDGATPDGGGGGTDGGGGGTDGGGGGTDGGGPLDSGLPGGERFTITWGPVDVPSGEENTQCVVKRLGNTSPIHVGAMINHLGTASHHLIVYRIAETTERPDPFSCDPFVDTLNPTNGSPLAVSQRAEETIMLPEGVGYTLEANQMIRLELHYINTTPSTQSVEASTTFVTIPDADFMHEADFLFIGNPDIDIPARSMATLGPTWFPLPAALEGSSFFAITGHEHQYGTNVTVSTAASASGPETSVYDVPGWLWEEPETVYHDPAFQIPSGGGFKFTCEWNNTSDRSVGFGESANEEMCFFWAYYYPSQGAKVCFHTDQTGSPINLCCPGDPLCSLVAGFL